VNFPKDLKYTKDHEWAKVQGNHILVGITDHAQQALGDIVYVELPQIGRTLKSGDTFGVVESIKAVSDLFSPVNGKVVKVNSALTEQPEKINTDPYENSWIIELEVSGPAADAQVDTLMSADSYSKYVQSLK